MRQGEQAWYYYGSRTNRFLIMHYGFCFQNNLQDSLVFDVRLDMDYDKTIYPTVAEMAEAGKYCKAVQSIRLKRHQFCQLLLGYIRSCFKEGFIKERYNGNKQAAPNLLLSAAVDLDFEMVCLKRYLELIEHQRDKLEATSTLEDDIQLLQDDDLSAHASQEARASHMALQLTNNQRFALVYRSERKKIARA